MGDENDEYLTSNACVHPQFWSFDPWFFSSLWFLKCPMERMDNKMVQMILERSSERISTCICWPRKSLSNLGFRREADVIHHACCCKYKNTIIVFKDSSRLLVILGCDKNRQVCFHHLFLSADWQSFERRRRWREEDQGLVFRERGKQLGTVLTLERRNEGMYISVLLLGMGVGVRAIRKDLLRHCNLTLGVGIKLLHRFWLILVLNKFFERLGEFLPISFW